MECHRHLFQPSVILLAIGLWLKRQEDGPKKEAAVYEYAKVISKVDPGAARNGRRHFLNPGKRRDFSNRLNLNSEGCCFRLDPLSLSYYGLIIDGDLWRIVASFFEQILDQSEGGC